MLGQIGKQNPLGWTDQGMPRGWMVPARTPQTRQLKQLTEENKSLRSNLADLMDRVARLEADNGN